MVSTTWNPSENLQRYTAGRATTWCKGGLQWSLTCKSTSWRTRLWSQQGGDNWMRIDAKGENLDVSKNGGVFLPNHPLKNRVFHYFHHPFWGKHPYFWKHPSKNHQLLLFQPLRIEQSYTVTGLHVFSGWSVGTMSSRTVPKLSSLTQRIMESS